MKALYASENGGGGLEGGIWEMLKTFYHLLKYDPEYII